MPERAKPEEAAHQQRFTAQGFRDNGWGPFCQPPAPCRPRDREPLLLGSYSHAATVPEPRGPLKTTKDSMGSKLFTFV